MSKPKIKVLVLGAGFGGLEVSRYLSDSLGDQLDLILIDKNDSFFFGFSKLDVMFWKRAPQAVKHPYNSIKLPGVRFRQETITSIDPENKRVCTDKGVYEADVLVVALGADYDYDGTPGLLEGGDEFYSFSGAEKIRKKLPSVQKGNLIVGVTSAPFKCPPAPSEAAILLDEYLTLQGVRQHCHIRLVVPFELPIPPSYGASKALLKEFKERNIEYIPEIMVYSIDPGRKMAILDDGTELPFDLFLGVPAHCVPKVVAESGLVWDEWVPVDKSNLRTKFDQVFAIGDITSVGTPKSGIFAEKAAQIAAQSIIADYQGKELNEFFDGKGFCYIEYGRGLVSKVDVDFSLDNPSGGLHYQPSVKLAKEKKAYGANRKLRWFGE